jgi:hypothetical protein
VRGCHGHCFVYVSRMRARDRPSRKLHCLHECIPHVSSDRADLGVTIIHSHDVGPHRLKPPHAVLCEDKSLLCQNRRIFFGFRAFPVCNGQPQLWRRATCHDTPGRPLGFATQRRNCQSLVIKGRHSSIFVHNTHEQPLLYVECCHCMCVHFVMNGSKAKR